MDIRRILKETIWTNIHEVSILGKYRILLFFSLNFLIYVSVMTYFGLVRFQDLLAPTFDMGVKIQTIFTSINGIPIDTANYVTNAGIGGINFFATHFSPLTFALSPFLHFFPPAIFLLGFQWTCIYLASPLIYLIAKIEGLSERNSLIISTLYLLYPPMIMSGMYDIHFLALYPLASLMIYYGFKKSNYFLYIFGFILGWAAQESFFLLATFFIILLYIEKKPGFKSIFSPALIDKKDLILIVSFILSLVVYFYEVFIYMKGFVPNRPNPLFSSNGYHLSIENIFINPVQKFEYWFFVFLFLGFIPALGSKKLILILPAFILTLFTTN